MRHLIKSLALCTFLSSLVAFAAPGVALTKAKPPDAFLTSRAKLMLLTAPEVHSSGVHVDTNDGVVTLYGKVPSDTQRELVLKTVAAIDGVTSVRNLLQVVPAAQAAVVEQSDKELKALAEKSLSTDPYLKDTKIKVKTVDKGVVMLSGQARTYSEHLRAIVVVDRIAGVKLIATDVKLPADYREDERITFLETSKDAPVSSPANDTRISAEVKMRLLTAPAVPSTEISVDTDDGTVTLFGIVPSAEVKTAAGLEARKVNGVLNVDNELEVVPASLKKFVDAKDAEIAQALALVAKDRPEFKGVKTSVKNGTVMLSGSVSSGWQQLAAIRTARTVAGVRSVENNLKFE
ncbi:MAG: BON domain-containing protein [Archangium sp.]